MRMKSLRVWLLIALVFLAGFAGGVLTTRIVTRGIMRSVLTNPNLVRERIERDLDRRLRLDETQEAEVHRVLVRSCDRLKELRQDFQPRVREILGEARQEISAVLRPEQRRKLERYLEDHPLPEMSGSPEKRGL